jgi:hypothetical protein
VKNAKDNLGEDLYPGLLTILPIGFAGFNGPQDANANARALWMAPNHHVRFVGLAPAIFKASNRLYEKSTSRAATVRRLLETAE